ncbi:MAG: PLAT/LH2 domain-containing protein [Chloroflexota bacterium]
MLIIVASSGCEYDVPGYGVHMVCDENNNCEPVSVEEVRTPKPTVTYTIWAQTGNVEDSDTDGDVFITLLGSNGPGPRLELDTEGYDDFEVGVRDWYYFTLPNLGEIHAVCVEHRYSGERNGWYLEEIQVDSDEGESWYFAFDQWLSDDDQTGNQWTCKE